ncbi:TonB-dependent receptor [Gluconobacter roseus]|uniref:Ligand-gated channel n=1 Tax=Gluconobacter roseus NBRC 3990 TaxID=1307950 RepID=A0A4Y3M0X8_9PROT|nr:TonB-dependent receptor [Gluconobacter roseus]GEB02922.1 ligand-gated channel [Gluconobacter roseus NBRC 3990]GLP93381.1 ligand-gated channel [Gluconobacter roseus NBRC 3990]
MRTRSLLLSSIALFAVRQSALAADPHVVHHHPTSKDKATVTASAPTAQGRKTAAPARHRTTELDAHATESVAVTGRQLTGRDAEQAVSKAIMRQYVPGTSAYKMLDRTPGVSFTSTDPFGIDSFGANLYVRGFFMNQMGVTVDGVPLNDQTYQSVSGMSLASAIIPDDIQSMRMSQGAGSVELPSTNTLGGTIQIGSSDPEDKRGGKVSQSFGSYGSYRTYVRLDSGKLNPTGTKFYTSYARTDEGMWMGGGDQFMQQVDAKLVQPINERSRMSAFFNWSSLAQWNYPDTSIGILKNLGWRTPHLYPNYGLAYGIANGTSALPAGYGNVPGIDGSNIAMYDGGQAETNYMGGLHFDLALTDHLTWNTTIYGHSQTGYYSYTDSDDPSPNGAPFSEEVWQNRQERYGLDTSLRYKWGRHTFEGGVWYENNNQQAGLFNYQQPLLGQGAPLKAVGPYDVYGPAFLEGYNFQWTTNVMQFHLQDSIQLAQGLTLHAGFKSMTATTSGGAQYNNADWTGADALPNGSLTASQAFLPHVNLDWHINRHHEIYVDVAENMRAYEVSAYGVANSVYSVQDQATFQAQKKSLEPSKAWVYLGGYRYTSKYLQANATVYHASLIHPILAAAVGSLTNPVSQVIDFGHISMTGANGDITITPIDGLSISNNLSYNKGTYDRNVDTVGGYYALAGKNIVNYPAWMYKTSVAYSWKGMTAHFDANYYSRRYYSFMNDTSIGGYWLANAGAQYRFGKLSVLKDVTASFNVYNLFNTKYISMMGENDNPAVGDYQSMERGPVREFFGTISASF